jgi:hypothetical protein
LFRIQIDRPHRDILSRSSACTASQRNLQCSNVGKRRPESREPGAANRLLLIAEIAQMAERVEIYFSAALGQYRSF